MIVNYDSSIVNKYGASLTDYARVVIYNNHLFIVQATSVSVMKHFVIAEKATISLSICPWQNFPLGPIFEDKQVL